MPAVINRGSNVLLDVHRPDISQNGAKVHQWEYNDSPNQEWDLVDASDGWIWLKNVESGKSLDVHRPDINQNGAKVHQWDYNATPNQQWKVEDIGDGWFWLRNRESGRALDVHSYDVAKNGAKIQQWDYNGTANQQWRFADDPTDARFTFGPFEFDTDITTPQLLTLMERHRFARSRVDACGSLNSAQRTDLQNAYNRAIQHSVTTAAGVNGQALVGGSQLWINFGVLFPRGNNEIAQTLVHEMMHCAGYNHPARQATDTPGDGGPYYGTPPLQAEICIAGVQSDTECVDENGWCTIRS